ncbi:MAG: hypothetical protein ACI8ZX_001112 [Planctomycetota bacterium]|jgi:hypothetical protein
MSASSTKQTKSKKRVSDHGEVFTSEREVNAMLDLVKQETERIDSRFLEPACGTGNFLVEILRRKLKIVKEKYKKSQLDYERNAMLAISSVYGVDILNDNVKECIERLYLILKEEYTSLFKRKHREIFLQNAKYLLSKNILWGNALTLKKIDDDKPIVFSEWSFVTSSMITRREFEYAELTPSENNNLFNEKKNNDLGKPSFIPKPVKDYPTTHFLKIANND